MQSPRVRGAKIRVKVLIRSWLLMNRATKGESRQYGRASMNEASAMSSQDLINNKNQREHKALRPTRCGAWT